MHKTIDNIKVYGIDGLGNSSDTKFINIENKNDPKKWNWIPFSSEKIIDRDEILRKEKKEVDFSMITNYYPTNIRQKIILFFEIGCLSNGFISNCRENNIKFLYIDYCRFLLEGKVNISIDADQEEKKILSLNGISVDLNDIAAIVWNPPYYLEPIFDSNNIPNENGKDKFIFKKRWTQLLKDLTYLVPEDTIWLPGNPFVGSQHWQNKIGEYSLAKRLGLNVPPYIFTNNESDLQAFILKNNVEQLLLREFSTPPFSQIPYHLDLNDERLNLQNSPCCFQKYVEKKFELRIVILFDKVFPCKIYSQDSELAKKDWRVHDDPNVKWELSDIPEEIKQKLLTLTNELKLTWASIDMIYGADDKYYFLEANRPGAHYWLDAFVGLDITKEIILELKERIQL